MSHKSKRLREGIKTLAGKTYSISEALDVVKSVAVPKFDAGVEMHMRLGIDPKKSDQSVRGVVSLPHGVGKVKKIIAFVRPDKEKEAKEAGADIIADEEYIKNIKNTEKVEADVAVATPDMMRKLAPIAKILGQRGMMPNPKTETVTTNVTKTIKELKSGSKISFRADDGGNIHQLIGKMSFSKENLEKNFETFLEAVKKAKPDTIKGTFIKNLTLCSTMGPAIKVHM